MREGKELPAWDFGHVRRAEDDGDDVFAKDDYEEEEDAREAYSKEEQAWIAHPALLPIMPRMDGRRWSFDL